MKNFYSKLLSTKIILALGGLFVVYLGVSSVHKGAESSCLSNSDCAPYGNNLFCQVEATDCHTIKAGTCQKVSPFIKQEKVSYDQKYLTLSNQGMNWFSANNWCAAQNMRLVQLSDFHVSPPKDTCYYSSQENKENYCDLTKETEAQLRGIFGSQYYYWTASLKDSCYAFGMCFINNYVRPLNKDATLRHAVCIQ